MKKLILSLAFLTMFNGALKATEDSLDQENQCTELKNDQRKFGKPEIVLNVISAACIFTGLRHDGWNILGSLVTAILAGSALTTLFHKVAEKYTDSSNNESSIVHSSLPCANATESTVSIEMSAKINQQEAQVDKVAKINKFMKLVTNPYMIGGAVVAATAAAAYACTTTSQTEEVSNDDSDEKIIVVQE